MEIILYQIHCSKQISFLTYRYKIEIMRNPGTDRSDLVQDFLSFVGSGPVRTDIFKFFLDLVPEKTVIL